MLINIYLTAARNKPWIPFIAVVVVVVAAVVFVVVLSLFLLLFQ